MFGIDHGIYIYIYIYIYILLREDKIQRNQYVSRQGRSEDIAIKYGRKG